MLPFERLYALHRLLLAIMDENEAQLLRASTESIALIPNHINCVCQRVLEFRVMGQLYIN